VNAAIRLYPSPAGLGDGSQPRLILRFRLRKPVADKVAGDAEAARGRVDVVVRGLHGLGDELFDRLLKREPYLEKVPSRVAPGGRARRPTGPSAAKSIGSLPPKMRARSISCDSSRTFPRQG